MNSVSSTGNQNPSAGRGQRKLTEDWLAVGLGLLLFVISLCTLAGVDVFGWAVKTSVWLDPGKIMSPVSGKFTGLPGLGALVLTYLFLLGLLSGGAKLLGAHPGKFAKAFTLNIVTGELSVDPSTVRGIADSGDLESDLPALCLQVAMAAQKAGRPVVLLVDEMQYLAEEDLRALIVAMHRVAQAGLPLRLFGAGLPQLAALAGSAKSYAERLFAYPEVGALDAAASRDAIRRPVEKAGRPSPPRRSLASPSARRAIPTFCRSGDSTHGMSRRLRPSPLPTLRQRHPSRWRTWMPGSSAFASTG